MNHRKVIKQVIPKKTFKAVEPYGHWAEAALAQVKFLFPARKLKVIGVTGTDGKTTTCYLIYEMLKNSGKKTAMITTASVDYGDGKGQQPNPTTLTTGNVFKLLDIIKTIANNDVEYLVLEVSSHALNQRRVWGIPFYLAVHTNMSHEHLDYHGTFENYKKAKGILFELCNKNKNGLQTGVINADDKTASFFKDKIKNPVLYGTKNGDIKATSVKSSLEGNQFTVISGKDEYSVNLRLIGEFNVYNALAAVCVGHAVGLDKQQIKEGIASLDYVTGRMMPVDEGQNFHVFIDYAVTPAALDSVLATANNLKMKSAKVHIVFGATGDRDKEKRPIMGEVTSQQADYVYLTDDETYTEDPTTIIDAVYTGVDDKNKDKVKIINDRKMAIKAALKSAKKDDVVIISGIGHQASRNMGGKKVAWSDIEVTKELLKNKNHLSK
ncbi:UDP-N-acetylmuramoyl-L-alanyl-D-glutamate--2,6-diaminopimelate ligase [Candidatus Saccharibacteria bacterium]|nr:UDP-N-acetylmuramoyl-L-alanyl-D-glutamate--2,6-diaminopimelate ligase [Candidatus Saccharibacteria bacterium]